jgi:hypothetical protein
MDDLGHEDRGSWEFNRPERCELEIMLGEETFERIVKIVLQVRY